jgi:hypothetical protein
MQHRQSFVRFNDRTGFKTHARARRNESIKGLPDGVAAHYALTVNYQNRAGFIESAQGVGIAEIEGMLKQWMEFGWSVCRHPAPSQFVWQPPILTFRQISTATPAR